MSRDRSTEYSRRKANCILQNICLQCGKPKPQNRQLCIECAKKQNESNKQRNQKMNLVGICRCGLLPLMPGKKRCEKCLEREKTYASKARIKRRNNGICMCCGGNQATNGVVCEKCREKNTALIMNKYHKNINNGVCANCGGELTTHKFRCDTCHKIHLIRGRVRWHKIRKIVLNHYGNTCACCGTTQKEFLEIDHIYGNGKYHRSISLQSHFYKWIIRNDFPNYLQILCANCNRGKSRFEACPHQCCIVWPTNRRTRKAWRRRQRAITGYGGVCRHCGESNWAFLEFDHVNDDGKQHRAKLNRKSLVRWILHNNFPNTIQLLCSNCNKAKWIKSINDSYSSIALLI